MGLSGDLLLDAACSLQVRAAIQAVFPGARLRHHDIGNLIETDHVTLNQACAVVLGLRNERAVLSISVVERLRAIAPHIGVFVIDERSEAIDPWLPRLAASGVDEAIALDRPGDHDVLRDTLAKRVALPPPELTLRALWSLLADCPVRGEVMYCVRNGYRPWRRFAPQKWLGLSERSLRTRFERAGFPTPLFFTRFGRVLHWKESVARAKRNRVELAMLLGFETVDQLGLERRRVRRGLEGWPTLLALLA